MARAGDAALASRLRRAGQGGPEWRAVYEARRENDYFLYSTLLPHKPKMTLTVEAIMGGERHGLSFLATIEKLGGIPLERRALIEARRVYNTPHRALALSPGFPTEPPRSYETAFGRTLSPTFETECPTCHGEPCTWPGRLIRKLWRRINNIEA